MYKFSKAQIQEAIDKTQSMAMAAKFLGINYDTFKKYAKNYNLFTPNQVGKNILKGIKYKTADDIFKPNNIIPSKVLTKWLKQERDWKCEECCIDSWNGKELTLEIDHVDGDNCNNERNNLKILCPNCHSQTNTWRGKGIKKKKVSDDDLKEALTNSSSIRQALIKVGLSPKGGNYARAYNLIYD